MVTAATIHMAIMGGEGLYRMASASHANCGKLVRALGSLLGVEPAFDAPVFHERVIRLPIPAKDALRALAAHNVLGGFDLCDDYPELGSALLVCATELRADEDIEQYRSKLERVIASQAQAPCKLKPDW
jgi:glycine dehydrogenase subunit 1